MKKVAIIVTAMAVSSASVFAQAADGTDDATVTTTTSATGVKRIVETREGQTTVITKPTTKITTTIPRRVIVRESLDAFWALGLRTSLDYHFAPGAATVSCIWGFLEYYNAENLGFELGLGVVGSPTESYTDRFGTTFTGNGMNTYFNVDAIGKYYFWFAQFWWVGGGFSYNAFLGGNMIFANSGVTAAANNPAAPTTAFRSIVDVDGDDEFHLQIGTGVRIALTDDARLNFVPQLRVLFPLQGNSVVMRINLGLAYDFPID